MIFIEIPKEGVVDVSGVAYTEVEKDRILEIIKNHQGISTVENKITVMPSNMGVEWDRNDWDIGSMRQRGHHAVSFFDERHFDDPDVFNRNFVLK